MDSNELLEIAKDIRKTLDDVRREKKLSFVEETHTYGIYDPVNERITTNLPSVSGLLKNWYTPFDALEKSLQKTNQDEKEAEKLRNKWSAKGDMSSSVGSYAHFKLEQYVWNLFDIDMNPRKPQYNLTPSDLLEAQKMLKVGVNLVHTIIDNGFVPLATECIMGSYELGYFGQCDNIWIGEFKGNIVFLMTDYKTNLSKNFSVMPYNKPMLEPFSSLMDTALSKYFIQQPLYAQLFKDMLKDTPFKDIPFIGFRVLHLRENGESIKIPRWVYDEVQQLYPIKNND